MKKYSFYYDESEHSRKINHKTITADNYYDNFIAVVVGWSSENEVEVFKRYAAFEEKYTARKSNGELKSTTIKHSQLKNGFASLNKDNTCLLEDFLSLFDEKILIYFAVISKVEYIILQLFENYQNSIFEDMDAFKYSIVKSLLVYQPKEIIEGIFENTDELISLLKGFFQNKIEQNKSNIALKQKENEAFEQILILLDDIHTVKTIDWNYDITFFGLKKYLCEKAIDNYSLIIDKEGENGNTSRAAQRVGIGTVAEEDSVNSFGIRMADMLAGLISKLLKALHSPLCYSSPDVQIRKKLLEKYWFQISDRQLNLYKKLHYVISLLNNAYACKCLSDYFDKMRNKLPVDPVGKTSSEHFLNQRGAKVYFNTNEQPLLEITNGKRVCDVLSVGFSNEMIPMITVAEASEAKCYRLPMELSEWTITLVGFANMGTSMFPAKVIFSKTEDRYYADIL